MSDHGSGPRAFADPIVDITDMYVFPSPETPGRLVLAMDVFPFAGPTALFSDAVDCRFRLRALEIAGTGADAAFTVSPEELAFNVSFASPVEAADGSLSQLATCTTSFGPTVSVTVNSETGGHADGLRVFAGRRTDHFFYDGVHAVMTVMSGELSFEQVGTATTAHQNCLSVIVEVDTALLTAAGHGPVFGVVSETVTNGDVAVRLERFGRPEIKNLVLMPRQFDKVNRDLEIRDLYNGEDAFALGETYLGAYRARMNGTLAFWDGLDGKTDWPLSEDGAHPLTELLLADFMVVDVSKPYADDSALEIEQAMLRGERHNTCGGRSPDDDCIDTFVTLLVNAGNGPRISDGVEEPPTPVSHHWPYLLPPNPNPPPVKPPALKQ